ncbi:hypothetical protein P152DRAFT_488116 [Eremomyces bilateralis CBS 781.70]|uniref:Zn(2)-C6 fungal-type domain-containing protein n=1 Tax=Eremomyces bilateralis CBS 781.70 TaxID=1392243 RepID=A0A6G1G1B1_9PEZI|nr:uncharacterized protein P152DRAFT_488116 [Eremomyces bilateralis CBS 781.70]KAF1811897.1 hypothetical protein P152DRAFT_488116 [Eremomyces bilateralis CBS 781.70]
MATPENQSQSPVRKTRRRHQKSRNGCIECRRRRVKCDEMKPSCTRCVWALDKCIYRSPFPQQSAEKHEKDQLSLPTWSSLCSVVSPSPSASSHSERSPSFEASASSTPAFVEAKNRDSNVADGPQGLSDTDLYHHYLQHTSRTLTLCPGDENALQIGMPTLALQSKTVFHSILAVSAACLGWDMISKKPPPDISVVSQALMTGYRHYSLASEQMRESISCPGDLKPEPLLASTLMLVPFAAASQQINHWISSKSGTPEPRRLLSTTPRDVIIMMRGIRTTLQTLDSGNLSPNIRLSLEPEFTTDSSPMVSDANIGPAAITPPRTHVMVPIVAATSHGAFSKLQTRLESAVLYHSDGPDGPLSACSAAFEILKDIRNNAFSTSNLPPSSSPNNPVEDSFEPETEPVSLSQVAPWLHSFASRSAIPLPTEPLTRYFLSFLIQAPQAYLDLVLPLLDQRLESPVGNTSEIAAKLTSVQALALNIYAHWSVLMFLVEEESWWIGNLPTVTLSGMVNRYGDDFVTTLWPDPGQEQWWPGSMLNILREIKRHR